MNRTAAIISLLGIFVLFAPRLAAADGRREARAVRISEAPLVDGDLSDPVWGAAPWHDDFTQFRPVNGAVPTLETAFAAVYDEEKLYIAVRCGVPDREEIISRLTRRDRWGDFDTVTILLAPRDDGRTGYSFDVNPDGVMGDSAWYDDKFQDRTWDAVWEAETRIADDAWTLELAIPFDQLRFPEGQGRWGIQVRRWASHRQEGMVFNPVPPEKSGWVSAAGALTGVEKIRPSRPFSIVPEAYFSLRESTAGYGGRGEDGLRYGAGGYGKLGVGDDLVFDVALNPDFGQVEVDQAVLNLSAYEVQFPEKRPFFLEGVGLFKTPIELFYSRRIGAPPPDPSLGEDESVWRGPGATPILGAAKLTGRSPSGLSVGMIEAVMLPTEFTVVDEESGATELESGSPWTSASVLRLSTEVSRSSNLGLTATALNPEGANGAYSGGVDWNLLDPSKEYAFRGQLAGTLRFDEVLGREAGHGGALHTKLAREGGEHVRVAARYKIYSKGFDPNDLGFFWRDDLQCYSLELKFQKVEKVGPFAQLFAGLMPHGHLTTDGLNLGQDVSAYFQAKWLSDWVTEIGARGYTSRYDDRETRGGPNLERSASGGGWIWIRAAQRKLLGGHLRLTAGTKERGYYATATLTLKLRLRRVELELVPGYKRVEGELAHVDTLDEDDPMETTVVGDRDLDQVDLGLKGTLVIVRDLTLQLSSQLLTGRADYDRYRLLARDGSAGEVVYDDEDADFVRTDLRLQLLLRWEYLPGSALYAVYTHFGFTDLVGSDPTIGDGWRSLADEEREQLFMIKLSHRFG